MKLYSYWRSSASYRVRIALNLKQQRYDYVPVHLVDQGGYQHAASYRALNPQELVPLLVLDDGTKITQSLAIIEYLEEQHKAPSLLPADPVARAHAREIAQAIACDIHPLNNLRVMQYLEETMQQDKEARRKWYEHWIAVGLSSLETLLRDLPPHKFCVSDTPGLADLCLIPQLYNARRYRCPLETYPRLLAIEEACLALPAFADAVPERQPDAIISA